MGAPERVDVVLHRGATIALRQFGAQFVAEATDRRGRPLGRFQGRDPARVLTDAREGVERIEGASKC